MVVIDACVYVVELISNRQAPQWDVPDGHDFIAFPMDIRPCYGPLTSDSHVQIQCHEPDPNKYESLCVPTFCVSKGTEEDNAKGHLCVDHFVTALMCITPLRTLTF